MNNIEKRGERQSSTFESPSLELPVLELLPLASQRLESPGLELTLYEILKLEQIQLLSVGSKTNTNGN